MAGNLLHVAISFVVNKFVVKGLANSLSFQRFAVRTSRRIESLAELAAEKQQQLAEQMRDMLKNFDSFKNR